MTAEGTTAYRVEWRDGAGTPWTVHATADHLVISGEGRDIHIPRDAWRERVTFAPHGSDVVLHIDAGDREIGFLVPMAQVRSLFTAMGGGQLPTARPATVVADEAPAASARRPHGPLWPQMTTLPVVALCLSVLAFIPYVGVPIGLIAFAIAWRARRGTRDNAAHLHIRRMAQIAQGFAVGGMAISVFATMTMMQPVTALVATDLPVDAAGGKWGMVTAAIVMIVLALSVHEAAHAITAWWFGDGYARSVGRVTLNPLAHIDPFGTVLFPLLLALAGLPVFGWARPVPVQLHNVRHYRKAQIMVSAAGPLSNLLQACICMALLVLAGSLLHYSPAGVRVGNFSGFSPQVRIEGMPGGEVLAAGLMMLKLGVMINIMLAFFNMLPIPPLDGSWITEQLSPAPIRHIYARIRPYGFLIFIALLYTQVIDYLMIPGYYTIVGAHVFLMWATGL